MIIISLSFLLFTAHWFTCLSICLPIYSGFEEEAVEHYIEGKQDADAVRLIEKNLQPLMLLLEQLKSQIDSPDHALFVLKIEAQQACLSLQQGSSYYAAEWLQRCGMSHTDEISLSSVNEHLVLARVLALSNYLDLRQNGPLKNNSMVSLLYLKQLLQALNRMSKEANSPKAMLSEVRD
jgi:Mg2+ and Co2+ transporter CorA